MKKILTLLLFGIVMIPNLLRAQAAPEPVLGVQLNHDANFGLFPMITGSFPLKKKPQIAPTFYSIFWTNGAWGRPDGTGLYVEVGGGITFTSKDKVHTLVPTLGFNNGNWVSGNLNESVLGDAIVPSVLWLMNSEHLDVEFFGTYYAALRQRGPVTRDYFIGWAAPAYKITPSVAVGPYYELYALARITGGKSISEYSRLGASVKFTVRNVHWFRFSAGASLVDRSSNESGEFYKATLNLTF